MSINCKSSCVPYVTDNTSKITSATVDSYQCVNNSSKCSNTVSPPAFPVTVSIDTSKSPDTIYHISVGPTGGGPNNLNYDLIIDKNGAGTLGPTIPNGVSVSFPLGQGGNQPCGNPDSAVTRITLVSANNSLYPDNSCQTNSTSERPFKISDNYTINALSCCNNGTKSIDVAFERPLWSEAGGERADLCATLDCISTCSNVRVPVIIISGQITIDGSDMADILVTVYDKYSYQEEQPLSKNRICSVNYVDKIDLVKTVLRQCSAKMISVVRGKGETLYCKADYIWMNLKPTEYLLSFYDLLIKYGMLKYVLSRLLYGDFNINYLLANYNEKFLCDLGHSRFCQYVTDFEDCSSDIYGYNKFFKKEKVCNDDKHDKPVKPINHDKPINHVKEIKEFEKIDEIDFRYEKAEEDDKKVKKVKKVNKVKEVEKDNKKGKKVKEPEEIKESKKSKKSKKSNKNDINSEDFV
jgi:hypothetical protein